MPFTGQTARLARKGFFEYYLFFEFFENSFKSIQSSTFVIRDYFLNKEIFVLVYYRLMTVTCGC